MEARELRFNNYVKTELGHNAKIVTLAQDYVEVEIAKDVYIDGTDYDLEPTVTDILMKCSYSSISPIPLSPSILEKARFADKDESEEDRAYYFGSTHSFCIAPSRNGLYTVYVDQTPCSEIVHYLHQLQNLYYCLIGTELDINLNDK